MDDQQALFPARPYEVPPPAEPSGTPMSADRRRTRRQLEALARGRHPLEPVAGRVLKLHPEAAAWDDRTASGRRCGSCWHRQSYGRWSKCTFAAPGRITHSAASDVRRWWPACTDHSYCDPAVSGARDAEVEDDDEPGCELARGITCYCTGRRGCLAVRPNDEDDDQGEGDHWYSGQAWTDEIDVPAGRRIETITPVGGVL